MCSNMKTILEHWERNIENSNTDDKISFLIFIASFREEFFDALEMEIVSKLCSSIYKDLYRNDFAAFQELLSCPKVIICQNSFTVRNTLLWRAIWFSSLKNLEIVPSKTKKTFLVENTELLRWCIHFLLKSINIFDQYSIYLLRSLLLILTRTDVLVPSVSLEILQCMNKVALSPLTGFRQISENISQQAMIYLEPEQLIGICNDLSILAMKGINVEDVIKTFTDDFVKQNTEKIAKKVLMMFSTNIENKDGGFLYEKLLICTFDEWIDAVWPHFLSNLQKIEYEGQFFQSLVKYWVPLTVSAYRTDFYSFIKEEAIDQHLKAYIVLETRKKGFLVEREVDLFNCTYTKNVALKIVSTYRKKSLCPETEDVAFLMEFLYSNLNAYLECEELDSIRKFVSQMVFYAHNSLKKDDTDSEVYEDFVDQICKYCCASFGNDFYQVGGQVLHILLNILTGSHEDLSLIYRLEKKDHYQREENQLLITLKRKGLWRFDDMYSYVSSCFFRTKCVSLILTDLLRKCYSNFTVIDTETIRRIIEEVEHTPNLQNTEKIINSSTLLFTQKPNDENYVFIKEISDSLIDKLKTKEPNEIDLFKKVLLLEILTVANRWKYEINSVNEIVKYGLELIDYILDSQFMKDVHYRCLKVVETFITRVMFFISTSMNDVWPAIDKQFAVATLIKVIQKSNMKKPVSVSTDILRQFGYKMEETETDKIFKMRILNRTLEAVKHVAVSNVLKIRRSPETRLVIHALCISQRDQKKPLLHWTMNYLLDHISDPNATDLSISASLHTIELLISDNRLQNQTCRYVPDILVQCVELFRKPNWIVRNADLQLAKSLIERLYGVSMNNFHRPKNISDIFTLYPELASHFFKILSSEHLDERAVIVLQFFSESQIKENVLNGDVSEILDYFQILLVDIIKHYENHYGKLAVRAYVSACLPKHIPDVFVDLENYIISVFEDMPKNIFANLFLLMQELHEKYKVSYEHRVCVKGMKKIQDSWCNLVNFLKNFDSTLFDFLLLKVADIDHISKEKRFANSMWVHNNLSYLFLNGDARRICEVLDDDDFRDVPEFFHVKMLTILTRRFEQNDFPGEDLSNITNSLFCRALTADENDYLLNSYFKFLLVVWEYSVVKFEHIVTFSENIYKNLLNLLYVSKSKLEPDQNFFKSTLNLFKNSLSINDELNNDILSTLNISYWEFPGRCRSDICKIIFYLSLFDSTSSEAYNCMCTIRKTRYPNVLRALNDFLSLESLSAILGAETDVEKFLNDVNYYLDNDDDEVECEEEFYVVEGERLVPKEFVKKMLRCKCSNHKVKNKSQ